jgi:uncharacterized protein (TIGR02001 family)
VIRSRRASSSRAGFLYACAVAALLALVPGPFAHAISFGGDVAVTTDYIYRGYSETNNKGAVQLDLHASLQTGTFAGVWTSSLHDKYWPFAQFDVEEYIGQRFDLSSEWNTSITATNYQYLGGNQFWSSDYQQFMASISYLDRWTLSFSASPNMVRYSGWPYFHTARYPAYDLETSGQWEIARGFFVTGGAGYYLFTGGSFPFTDKNMQYEEVHSPGIGYAYGNVGLAYEWRSLRLDVGFFLTQKGRAQQLFPYPTANDRVAGTLSWRF